MQLRLNWTKLKITPLDILISASRDETFSCEVKLKSSQLTEATSCNRDVFSHINTPLDTTSKCGPVWEIVYMRRFAPFDTICTILKMWKKTHGGVLLLVKLHDSVCNFTKSSAPPWVFLAFFKLYKWYQTAKCITYESWSTCYWK